MAIASTSHSFNYNADSTRSSDRISYLSDRNVMLILSFQVVGKTVLSVVLDPEAEQYLVEILVQEKTTSSELIKLLLQERWRSLQTQKTVLERMGGYPEQLLDGSENLSDRDVRRAIIDRHLQQRLEN